MGETKTVAIIGLMMWDFGSMSFSIFCLGRIVFVLIEWMRVDVAKSPVRRGRRDWLMLRLRVERPRNPDRMKIIVALIFDSFSFRIRRIAIHIRRNPIMRWRSG